MPAAVPLNLAVDSSVSALVLDLPDGSVVRASWCDPGGRLDPGKIGRQGLGRLRSWRFNQQGSLKDGCCGSAPTSPWPAVQRQESLSRIEPDHPSASRWCW